MEEPKKEESKTNYGKKSRKKFIAKGQAHIKATYNNTVITICDLKGNVLFWSTSGKMGFKGPKKSTPYAAGVVVRDIVDKMKTVAMKEIDIFVRGVGSGREAAIRAFNAQGINISCIKDVTPIPHNGPRPKRPRRV
ncbi:MAG: 30S ribosomal protein S11 [Patescibacteria group bacterium]